MKSPPDARSPFATYRVASVDASKSRAVLREEGSGHVHEVGRVAYTPIATRRILLRPGDTVTGIVSKGTIYGEAVRGSVPSNVVDTMIEFSRKLEELGLYLTETPDVLALRFWNTDLDDDPWPTAALAAEGELIKLLPGHPDLDDEYFTNLVEQVTQKMARQIPGFAIASFVTNEDELEGYFVVQPGDLYAAFGKYEYEDPDSLIAPLIASLNDQLRLAGSELRWLYVGGRGPFLLRPELKTFLESMGMST